MKKIKTSYFSISLLAISALFLSQCGGGGCEGADEKGGVWKDTITTIVRPISESVIKSENQFGSYILKNGATEKRAQKNLWRSMKFKTGEDVLVKSGNKIKLEVGDSVMLSGSYFAKDVNFTKAITIGDTPTYSFGEIKRKQYDISSREPTSLTLKTTIKQDGTIQNEAEYTVELDDGSTRILPYGKTNPDGSIRTEYIEGNSSCIGNSQSIERALPAINYAIYYPKELIFDTFVDANGNYTGRKIFTTSGNGLICGVEDSGVDLYYYCTFTYSGTTYKYKRLVRPKSVGGFAQFYEQLINQTKYDSAKQIKKSAYSSDEAYKNAYNAVLYQSYLMCINAGNVLSGDCDKSTSQYSKLKIIRTISRSPIKLVIKNASEIGRASNTNNYTYNECFTNPSSYDIRDDHNRSLGKNNSRDKNRFLPEISNLQCSDGNKIKYNANCRMFPTTIKYNLRNYIKNNSWLWEDNLTGDVSQNVPQSTKNYCSEQCLDLCLTYFKPVVEDKGVTLPLGYTTSNTYIANAGDDKPNIGEHTRDKHFYIYAPVDNNANASVEKTGCSCQRSDHFFESTGHDTTNLKNKIYSVCMSGGSWGGLYAKRADNNGNYNLNTTSIGKDFSIIKYLREYYGGQNNWRNSLSYGICSPLSRSQGQCKLNSSKNADYNTEHCNGGGCKKIGWFYNNGRVTTDADCPNKCRIYSFEENTTATKTSGVENYVNTVINIDYATSAMHEMDPRKGSNSMDTMNTAFYAITGQVNSSYYQLPTISTSFGNRNLLPIASEDLTTVVCDGADMLDIEEFSIEQVLKQSDDESDPCDIYEDSDAKDMCKNPPNCDEKYPDDDTKRAECVSMNDQIANYKKIASAKIDKNCKVTGKYSKLDLDGNSGDLHLNTSAAKILPIQWTDYQVTPGAIIPIDITPYGYGSYPLLVKDSNGNYVSLTGGHGLIIYLDPDEENDDENTEMYSNLENLQCNVGTAGSYAKYKPYSSEIKDGLSDGEIAEMVLLSPAGYLVSKLTDLIDDTPNPRKIYTETGFWWKCDDDVRTWFSGYDFKNVKSGFAPAFHEYSTNSLNQFMRSFQSGEVEEKVDYSCGERGIPNIITLKDGTTITKSQISSILSTGEGLKYVYITDSGDTKTLNVLDGNIQSKSFPERQPKSLKMILNGEEVRITKGDHGLKRTTSNNINYYYKFRYKNDDYEIQVESSDIIYVSCFDDTDEITTKTSDEVESQILTEIPFTKDHNYYQLIGLNEDRVFTRLGPFSGMHVASGLSTQIIPGLYQAHHMCRGKYEYIYDTQTGDDLGVFDKVATSALEAVGINTNGLKGVERKPLDNAWRLEFTSPVQENSDNIVASPNAGDENDPSGGIKLASTSNNDDTLQVIESHCYAGGSTHCAPNVVPDVMIVDGLKTSPTINQTLIIYKNRNTIEDSTVHYYIISNVNDENWTYGKLQLKSTSASIKEASCAGYTNCGNEEIPNLIVLVKDQNEFKIRNGDNATVQKAIESSYSFEYNGMDYTIPVSAVNLNATTCYEESSCSDWLRDFITHGFSFAIASGLYDSGQQSGGQFSLGRLPYSFSCMNSVWVDRKYLYAYGYLDNNGNTSTNINYNKQYNNINESINLISTVDLMNQRDFARCTHDWTTAQWMLLDKPFDFSSWHTGTNYYSGSFIAEPNKTLSVNDVKTNKLNRVHAKFGGLVQNSIYKQTDCHTTQVGDENVVHCHGLSKTGTFTPSFVANYPLQLIAVKTVINDPLNAHSDQCRITASSGGKIAYYDLTMNEPFGTTLPTNTVNGNIMDKSIASNDVSGVSKWSTVNGNGKHGNEFFKQSEVFRNLIGAGIVYPQWHLLRNNSNNPQLFSQGETINITASSGSYYTMGNLSHASRSYCYTSGSQETALAAAWEALKILRIARDGTLAAALVASEAVTKIILVIALGIEQAALSASFYGLSNLAEKYASEPGKMKVENLAPRNCGVATAFQVVPLPNVVCFNGYKNQCTNSRINEKVAAGNETDIKLMKYCKETEVVDFQANEMNVGYCKVYNRDINDPTRYTVVYKKYKSSKDKYLNGLYDAYDPKASGVKPLWTEEENIYEAQCGACIKRSSITENNGISYTTSNLKVMPNDVLTSDHCNAYKDNDGESYRWVTKFAKITPLDEYKTSEKSGLTEEVTKVWQDVIKTCDASYQGLNVSYSTSEMKKIENAFLRVATRQIAACQAEMQALYIKYTSRVANTIPEECQITVNNQAESMAQSICGTFLERVKIKDGNTYNDYFFRKNSISGMCLDDKDVLQTTSDGLNSTIRATYKNLEKYGFGELSVEDIPLDGAPATFNIQIPNTIKGKKFKTATMGFGIAGKKTTDVNYMHSDFRQINTDDLYRGYTVEIGGGTPLLKGKYLYIFIQPLDKNGNPDPNYDPNTYFSTSTPHEAVIEDANGKQTTIQKTFTINEILESPMVYRFTDFDLDDDGKAVFVAPRTGKIWLAVIDSDGSADMSQKNQAIKNSERASNWVYNSADQDGKYILFKPGLTDTKVNENNTIGNNAGYYSVSGRVQVDGSDWLDDMLAEGDQKYAEKYAFVDINSIKKPEHNNGVYLASTNDEIAIQALSKMNENDLLQEMEKFTEKYVSVDEIQNNIVKDNIDKIIYPSVEHTNKDLQAFSASDLLPTSLFDKIIISPIKQILLGPWDNEKRVYKWDEGLIGKISTKLIKHHLLYALYFLLAVASALYFGIQILLGQQKIEIKIITKTLFKWSIMLCFLNPDMINLYSRLFIRGAYSLSEGIAAYAVGNFDYTSQYTLDSTNFVKAAFKPMDYIYSFYFSADNFKRILAILFSNWIGWFSVALLLLCLVHFTISTLEVVLIYMMSMLKMTLMLAIGPLVFISLVSEKTFHFFKDWLNSVASCIAEQVCLFVSMGAFCTLYYHMLKGSLNFTICWEPVLKFPVLDITLFSMWRKCGTIPIHMAEMMGDSAASTDGGSGFSVLTAVVLFFLTNLMSKVVDNAVGMGSKMFGGDNELVKGIGKKFQGAHNFVNEGSQKVGKLIGGKVAGKADNFVSRLFG